MLMLWHNVYRMHIFYLRLLGYKWTLQRCVLLLPKSFPREAQNMKMLQMSFAFLTVICNNDILSQRGVIEHRAGSLFVGTLSPSLQ
jgi:hypothetical protein